MEIDRLRTLLVDASDSFLAGAIRWLAGRRELTLVGTVQSGPEALDAVARLRPDLVILDAVLPGIDGYRVARRLKERADPPRVVIATFLPSEAARAEAFAAGADGFLGKEEFVEAMDILIPELTRMVRSRVKERQAAVTTPELGS